MGAALRHGNQGWSALRRTTAMAFAPPLVLLTLAGVLLTGCGSAVGGGTAQPAGSADGGGSVAAPLFGDTDAQGAPPSGPQVVRHRFVTIDPARLLDGAGDERGDRYVLNLFPDVVLEAAVDEVHQAGDTISWSGRLGGDPPGSFTMVYTAGVYQLHAAAPAVAFEVVTAGPGLYRVDQLDQSRFPQRD
jgi:hypothetical protein